MTEHLSHGRTRQKRRTRDALVEAAQKLVEKGVSPTVEDAAAEAGISRTTAYRYFRNQAELLTAAHPEIGKASLLPPTAPEDVEARLDLVLRQLTRIVADREAQYRTVLRLSLDPATPRESLVLRQGRAIRWIEDALAPLRPRVSSAEVKRLALAIRSACGIEALVWLVDVGDLTREEALKSMRWAGKMLLRGALSGKGST